jgi:hypothetical protein
VSRLIERFFCAKGAVGKEILHLELEQVELVSRNCFQFAGFAVGEGDSIDAFLRA